MTAESILAIGVGVRAAPTALVPGTGQSFILRSQDASAKLYMIQSSSYFTVASDYSIRSPRMHDNVLGVSSANNATAGFINNFFGLKHPMVQQDNLQVVGGIGGGAASFDNVMFTIWYESLVGASGNLVTWDSIKDRIKSISSFPVPVTPSAVGDWSAGVAVNAVVDLFKANTDYAFLGCLSDISSAYAGISGPCTGNVIFANFASNEFPGIGLPPNALLSFDSGLPTIPVMKSNDKAGTFLFVADPSGAISSLTQIWAELEG